MKIVIAVGSEYRAVSHPNCNFRRFRVHTLTITLGCDLIRRVTLISVTSRYTGDTVQIRVVYDLGRACCGTDNFLFVAAGRERLSVSQQETRKCDFRS